MIHRFVLAAAVASLALVAADGRADPPAVTVDQARMLPFAAMLNELSERRRRVVYAASRGSLYDGARVGLVQVGAGNVALRRVDLFASDLLPIEVARVYDSRRVRSADLGRGGWALALAERLEIDGDYARLILPGGGSLALRRDGEDWVARRPEPATPSRVTPARGGRWRAVGHDGLVTEYAAHADAVAFEIVTRTDRFGNTLHYDYDADDRLERVRSAGRTVTFERDAQGRVTGVEDGRGRRVGFAYDAPGFLVRVTDAGGHPWHYDYDAAGRLARAVAPGGGIDLDVDYDARGRVAALRRHASAMTFEYGVSVDGALDLSVTRVREAGRADRYFGQDRAGITAFARAQGRAGSRLALDAAGRPRSLHVGGEPRHEFDYDSGGRLRLWREAGAGARHYRYQSGGLAAIVGGDGRVLVHVARDADGAVRVAREGKRFLYALDARGAPVRVGFDAGRDYLLESDAFGHIVRVAEASGQTLGLEWDAAGRLSSASFPAGGRHAYRYDAMGLRTGATRGDGTHVGYLYTPSGRIHRYEVTAAGGTRAVTQHRFDARQRLSAVEGTDHAVRVEYGPGDRVRRIDGGELALNFTYDDLGRLSGVDNGIEAWHYEYAEGEPDLILVSEHRRPAPVEGRGGDAIASLYERRFLRRPASLYGPLRLDADLARFVLDGAFGVPLPGDDLRGALQAMGLIGVDGAPLAGAASPAALKAFESPSNLVFVPPEYWALNCIICFGVQPHGLIADRAAIFSLDRMAAALRQVCDVDTNVQPGCELAVSGLPQYLCDRTQAQIGADLAPTDLPRQFIEWSTNDYLVTVPVGVSGSPVLVRAVSPGGDEPSGSGAVTASYSRQGVHCASTAQVPVIANDPVEYAQLGDPASCPERQQDENRFHDVDGCSIEPLFADFALTGDPQDPVDGTYNVPGTSTRFGQAQGPLAHGTPPVNLPCNRHDVCYQSCGHHRTGCDSAFLQDMEGVCAVAYPNDCPYTFLSPACLNFELEKVECALISAELHVAVRLGGEGSYRQRQVQFCDCCPP